LATEPTYTVSLTEPASPDNTGTSGPTLPINAGCFTRTGVRAITADADHTRASAGAMPIDSGWFDCTNVRAASANPSQSLAPNTTSKANNASTIICATEARYAGKVSAAKALHAITHRALATTSDAYLITLHINANADACAVREEPGWSLAAECFKKTVL
jgi:hypothetical protein